MNIRQGLFLFGLLRSRVTNLVWDLKENAKAIEAMTSGQARAVGQENNAEWPLAPDWVAGRGGFVYRGKCVAGM